MESLTSQIATSLLSAPGINICLMLLGFFFMIFSRFLGYLFFLLGFIGLYLISTPVVSSLLISCLSKTDPLDLQSLDNNAQAIVVLSAGERNAPEGEGSGPSPISLLRESYAAKVYRHTQLPIYILGGKSAGDSIPEAKLMQDSLQASFNIPTKMIDADSTNTYENAMYAKQLLDRDDISSFYLVTSAWHMPRAMWTFEEFGMNPIAAATDYGPERAPINKVSSWLPNTKSLVFSSLALKEYFGIVWYKLVY